MAVKNPSRVEMSIDSSIPSAPSRNWSSSSISSLLNGPGLSIFVAGLRVVGILVGDAFIGFRADTQRGPVPLERGLPDN
jgi:hypothetical protein